MAHFLINCSNIRVGGSIQVADSICRQLVKYPQHQFVVVTSTQLRKTKDDISLYPNIEAVEYDMNNGVLSSLAGTDHYLDELVDNRQIDAVLTVFGPPRWKPDRPHLCGFARPHIVQTDSPYFQLLGKKEYILKKAFYGFLSLLFRRNADVLWTENLQVAVRLRQMYRHKRVYVVSNYYNQVFDRPDMWRRDIKLPPFTGTTCLTISALYVHKNLSIMTRICEYMEKIYPRFRFRFVLTLAEEKCAFVPQHLKRFFVFLGPVETIQCPFLYEQADIMFMPSLLECFSATYPEAMKMEVPIVTTDLEFAHGLCGDAALYYHAMDAGEAAEAIFRIASDKSAAGKLVDEGKKQLKKFDNYEMRVEKLLSILEDMIV